MSDGRAGLLMVLIASVVLCPPTRGTQSLGGSSSRTEAFTTEQPDISISCFVVRPPRPATPSPIFSRATRAAIVLEEHDQCLLDDAHLGRAQLISPRLRC
jgi:hypothetical protein